MVSMSKAKMEPKPKPKRFYKEVSVEGSKADGFSILLDGRTLKTPKKNALLVPYKALAEAMHREWEAQKDVIDSERMLMTKLVNVALDFTGDARKGMIEEICNYAGSDLTCYMAEGPGRLVDRQQEVWGAIRKFSGEALGFEFQVAIGVMPCSQAPNLRELWQDFLIELDDFALTGFAHATALLGSAAIAFSLYKDNLSAEAAYKAANLDDLWQLEVWGADEEAEARLDELRLEIEAIASFFKALA